MIDVATSQGIEPAIAARPIDQLSYGFGVGIVDSEIDAFGERPDLI